MRRRNIALRVSGDDRLEQHVRALPAKHPGASGRIDVSRQQVDVVVVAPEMPHRILAPEQIQGRRVRPLARRFEAVGVARQDLPPSRRFTDDVAVDGPVDREEPDQSADPQGAVAGALRVGQHARRGGVRFQHDAAGCRDAQHREVLVQALRQDRGVPAGQPVEPHEQPVRTSLLGQIAALDDLAARRGLFKQTPRSWLQAFQPDRHHVDRQRVTARALEDVDAAVAPLEFETPFGDACQRKGLEGVIDRCADRQQRQQDGPTGRVVIRHAARADAQPHQVRRRPSRPEQPPVIGREARPVSPQPGDGHQAVDLGIEFRQQLVPGAVMDGPPAPRRRLARPLVLRTAFLGLLLVFRRLLLRLAAVGLVFLVLGRMRLGIGLLRRRMFLREEARQQSTASRQLAQGPDGTALGRLLGECAQARRLVVEHPVRGRVQHIGGRPGGRADRRDSAAHRRHSTTRRGNGAAHRRADARQRHTAAHQRRRGAGGCDLAAGLHCIVAEFVQGLRGAAVAICLRRSLEPALGRGRAAFVDAAHRVAGVHPDQVSLAHPGPGVARRGAALVLGLGLVEVGPALDAALHAARVAGHLGNEGLPMQDRRIALVLDVARRRAGLLELALDRIRDRHDVAAHRGEADIGLQADAEEALGSGDGFASHEGDRGPTAWRRRRLQEVSKAAYVRREEDYMTGCAIAARNSARR